ncbi:LCP family protein [Streptomyces sp. NPDC006798]|uniref:LCP family protein n=1 Tax=Streptomyces sp. NPDC006798 TaxID=3155462 RepID=UPI0033C72B13
MTDSAGTPTGSDGPGGGDGGDGEDTAAGDPKGGGTEDRISPPTEATDAAGDGPASPVDPGNPAEEGRTDPGSEAAEDIPAAGTTATPDRSPGGTHTATATKTVTATESDTAPAARPRKRRRWLRWTAVAVSFVLLAGAATAWWFYRKLEGNITTDTATAVELRTYEKERPVPISLDAKNILLMGSDSRRGEGNSKYGRDDGGSQRADTVILLHVAADRQSSTSVSIPRDLMTTVPSCRRADGTRTRERLAQFNSAFETGGAACAIRTVELMTGVRIDHHLVVDFRGFTDMVEAVDGVEVCLKEPVDDPDAHLVLPAGRQTLDGEEALGYVRARKSFGNGSDTERMDRQQQFLGSLVKKVQSDGVLLNPGKLVPVLDAATKSLTTDPGLDSLKELYDLTRSLRNIPTENVQFLTVPRQPWAMDRNRDELVQPQASELFRQLREDSPITVSARDSGAADGGRTDGGTGPSGSPTGGARDGTRGTADPMAGTERAGTPGSPSGSPSGTPGSPVSASPPGSPSTSPSGSPSGASGSNPGYTGTNAAVGVCD